MEISLFEQALAIDPQSSVAMSGFANAYAIRVLDHMSDTKRSDLGRARELVSQAQALSPRAPLTDFVEANRGRKGNVTTQSWNTKRGSQSFAIGSARFLL